MEFFTIGVYNSTEQEFFEKLMKNKIDVFCDIRQRRGVRGSKYSFVNSKKLQQKLQELGIQYNHILDLAPTTEIRNLQKQIDSERGELKRERNQMGRIFVIEYKNRVLKNFNFDQFLEELGQSEAKRVVLFCVEENPEACHRSIVSHMLAEKYQFKFTHL